MNHKVFSEILLTIIAKYILIFYVKFKKLIFYLASSYKNKNLSIIQPTLIQSRGKITFNKNVSIGVSSSINFHSGYSYINLRRKTCYLFIGENTKINNNFSVISNGASIVIGKYCLIGYNVSILDSDFHSIDPYLRKSKIKFLDYSNIHIGNNVFIGNNVQILKGVKIGSNSVIASGAIVTSNVPENVVYGGIPAKLIKIL